MTEQDRKARQCELNIRALLQHAGLAAPRLRVAEPGRCWYDRDEQCLAAVSRLVGRGVFAPWEFVSNHGPTAELSWRMERARCSMQIIRHADQIEIDIDYGNPNYGVGPALLHLLFDVLPGETDPFRIARRLRKDGIEVPSA